MPTDDPPWHGGSAPQELTALSAEVADLLDRMLRVAGEGVEGEALERAARAVREAAEQLAPHARGGAPRVGAAGDAAGRPYYVRGSNVGPHNPVFPSLAIRLEGEVSHADVTLGVAHEGPPGCVHGGIVALLFDQVLGQHNQDVGIPAMTGTLTVRYRRPVPLHVPLALDARVRDRSGRKIVTVGALRVDGETLAEAEGIFVLPAGPWVGSGA